MNRTDLERLASFSDSVRDSTLKRLRAVPKGQENFRCPDGAMSFADLADHLIHADKVCMKLLETRFKGKDLGKSRGKVVQDREEFDALIEALEDLQQLRHEFVMSMDDDKLSTVIRYDLLKGKGEMSLGAFLYGILDHETHHRGAMVVYLSILRDKGF